MQVSSTPSLSIIRRFYASSRSRHWARRTGAIRGVSLTLPLALVVPLLLPPRARAQAPVPPRAPATPPLQTEPRIRAQQCAANEAALVLHPNSFLRYRMHVIDEKGDQVRDQIETPDGSVARLLLREGRPLTAEEDAAERGRLNYLLQNPAAFAHHIKNEQANKKTGVDLLSLMPRAMLWTFAPGQPPLPPAALTAGMKPPTAGSLVVLDFTPDPKWSPPSMPAEALTGLAGRIWIDAETNQMVYIEGSLIKPVNIGWGMVAHLYPGATVSLHQTRATADRWIIDHIVEQLNVRALMLKTIRQRLVYDTSDYHPVPSMTYQQAIKLLLESAPSAH